MRDAGQRIETHEYSRTVNLEGETGENTTTCHLSHLADGCIHVYYSNTFEGSTYVLQLYTKLRTIRMVLTLEI